MSIVSSVLISTLTQADGTVRVREQHTTAAGTLKTKMQNLISADSTIQTAVGE